MADDPKGFNDPKVVPIGVKRRGRPPGSKNKASVNKSGAAKKQPNGAGWGGPAKGYVHKPPNDVERLTRRLPPEVSASRREERIAQAHALNEVLSGIALDPKAPVGARIQAVVAYQNRTLGAPPTVNLNGSLEDGEERKMIEIAFVEAPARKDRA